MATQTGTLQMRRLHPRFGVEISGVDLSRPLDDGAWAHIWEAFNEHSLLLFRDQPLTDEEQMSFSRRFGAPFAPCVLVRRGGGWFCI